MSFSNMAKMEGGVIRRQILPPGGRSAVFFAAADKSVSPAFTPGGLID